ncbi:MAG: glycosyltransferase [Candidatus Helarchaeota archaeon]
MKKNILFIVENDYFPRDMRVYRECMTLANINHYRCYVLAPRKRKEKFIDMIEKKIKCFRYPTYEANNIAGLFIEYFITVIFYVLLVPFIVLKYRINIIHVANPPDFILPLCSWTKLFGLKLIFDQHDLSVKSFKVKCLSSKLKLLFTNILYLFEKLSYKLADLVIATNQSIQTYAKQREYKVKTIVIRNSNPVQFQELTQIPKLKSNLLRLGYFGLIGTESGGENLIYLCNKLRKRSINFNMIIIGEGSGLNKMRELVSQYSLFDKVAFKGFIDFSSAVPLIVNFDFGILPWDDCKKNHMHTAMKIMDYMCCGVPVCSLKLKEQIISAGNIGIFTDNFDDMADKILKVYSNKKQYEKLRRRTLKYFNNNRSWEIEAEKLKRCYSFLIAPQN